MTKFQVNPVKLPKKDIKSYDHIHSNLPKPPISMSVCAPRRSGKSSLAVNLLINGGYARSFSEVLILSETAAHDKTYLALKNINNVFVHDVRKHPIDNELLHQIWVRQETRALQDPKNDLLIIFDDLGNKLKSKEMRAQMNKYYQLSRHPKISFIVIIQSLLNATSEQISNSTQWIIFKLDQRALSRAAETLASVLKDRKELESWIKRNTAKKYSWVLINQEAESDDLVYQAFDPVTNTFSAGL